MRDYRSKIDPLGDTYDIRREGHPITGGVNRGLTVPKVEMTDGRLFDTQADRIHVLALLLESVVIDVAVRLGPPELWRQAIAELPDPK
jgi:hypothetical protein